MFRLDLMDTDYVYVIEYDLHWWVKPYVMGYGRLKYLITGDDTVFVPDWCGGARLNRMHIEDAEEIYGREFVEAALYNNMQILGDGEEVDVE